MDHPAVADKYTQCAGFFAQSEMRTGMPLQILGIGQTVKSNYNEEGINRRKCVIDVDTEFLLLHKTGLFLLIPLARFFN
jgi:hypothetical protein